MPRKGGWRGEGGRKEGRKKEPWSKLHTLYKRKKKAQKNPNGKYITINIKIKHRRKYMWPRVRQRVFR